jgi:hypothetical protein
MRLRTDIFVSALLRRVFAKGDFAAVEKKGAEQAGAIFIRQHFRDGLETLYGPAPQSFFDEEQTGERLFETGCSARMPTRSGRCSIASENSIPICGSSNWKPMMSAISFPSPSSGKTRSEPYLRAADQPHGAGRRLVHGAGM